MLLLSSTALKLKQGINHVSKLFFLMFIRDECSTCFKWGFFPFLFSCTMYNHSVFWSCLVEDFCFFHICLLNTGRQNYRVQSTFCFYTILKIFINIKNSVFVSIKCKYGILDCLRHAFYMYYLLVKCFTQTCYILQTYLQSWCYWQFRQYA